MNKIITIYSFFYRPIQNLISFLLKKKDFRSQLSNYLDKNKYEEIYDIGCSDGKLASVLNLRGIKYFGYDVDYANVNKAKYKFKNQKNIRFYHKSIDKISLKKKTKKIFILIGVLHHLDNNQISMFLSKLSPQDSVIALDPFFHENQNFIGYFMKKMDKGDYIRTYIDYKNILSKFILRRKISYYLRCYSHVISFKNINKKKINHYF